jgi:DNA mismatch endonuclease, patch repair protein
MRANRRTDTKPEMALRRALHRQGFRFRKDYRLDLAEGKRVRPDIAFTARRVAIFVDGCFWHACPEHGTKPANNVWYWEPKLRRNVERDRAADAALAAAGWDVVRIWEHEPLEAAMTAVLAVLARSPGPHDQAGAHVGGQVGAHAGDQPGTYPGGQVGAHAGDQRGSYPGGQVGSHAGDQPGSYPGGQVGAYAGDQAAG